MIVCNSLFSLVHESAQDWCLTRTDETWIYIAMTRIILYRLA